MFLTRAFGYIFSWFTLGGVVALALFAGIMQYFYNDLPSLDDLQEYNPATVSRVYDNNGAVLDEFAIEKRLYTPADEIPDIVKNAFISAEDKRFYEHTGYDLRAIGAAIRDALQGDGRGASTIPMQVAKITKLGGEIEAERKIKEVMVAARLVNDMGRDDILGLYLNEIFLGENSYGVTAAARTYFAKTLEQLDTEEAAYLAAIPKGPANYQPVRHYERAVERRNFVLKEMMENGYIDEAEYERAKATPLRTVQNGDIESYRESLPRRDYFTDEVRRQLERQFGKDTLFNEGLSVRATIDEDLQTVAENALRDALEQYDRALNLYHGPAGKVDPAKITELGWEAALDQTPVARDIEGWFPSVILSMSDGEAQVGIEGHGTASIPLSAVNWARYRGEDGARRTARRMDDMFDIGDVIFLSARGDGSWKYRQVALISGAFAAIDPHNGRVLALAGGFSYEASNFNRATQAMRQPGSVFKPFVYAAALDSGYQPNSIIVDAPIKGGGSLGLWQPKNAGGGYYGPTPMMTGLEQSRNLMTIRLGLDVGMNIVADYGNRYGVYDDMKPYPANSLGSQETTLYRLISAYSTFANGGRAITPTVVDRVQDRRGNTLYRHDQRNCVPCAGREASPENPPRVMSNYEQVMDPVTATQIRIMLQSVVARGTARATVGKLGLPIAGKTGTTNDAKDAWFIGFTPNIVAGCFMGYDNPDPLLNGRASGGGLCGPVFVKFIKEALKKHGGFEYEIPENGYFVNIDRKTGARLGDGASGPDVIRMFFRGDAVPAQGVKPRVIDGGYKMGKDVPLIDQPKAAAKPKEATVSVGGKKKVVPKNVTAGTISGGGLY